MKDATETLIGQLHKLIERTAACSLSHNVEHERYIRQVERTIAWLQDNSEDANESD